MARTDAELIEVLLEDYAERLTPEALEAFSAWREKGVGRSRPISEKQRQWLRDVAEKLGVQMNAANVFSSLSKKEQTRQKQAAAGILPWERGEEFASKK